MAVTRLCCVYYWRPCINSSCGVLQSTYSTQLGAIAYGFWSGIDRTFCTNGHSGLADVALRRVPRQSTSAHAISHTTFFNALWSWLFFAWQLGAIAFAEILLLWLLIATTLVLFWRIRPLAGALLIPFVLWISFAVALNYTLWQLNHPDFWLARRRQPPNPSALIALESVSD
jgi:hypothetical protein